MGGRPGGAPAWLGMRHLIRPSKPSARARDRYVYGTCTCRPAPAGIPARAGAVAGVARTRVPFPGVPVAARKHPARIPGGRPSSMRSCVRAGALGMSADPDLDANGHGH